MTNQDPTSFDLARVTVELQRDGTSHVVVGKAGHGPTVDGFVVGAPVMTEDAPHGGEMHPDGDEVLHLISGRVQVTLEESGTERTVELGPGQGLVVPRGVWHRVHLLEPSQIFHITPGPGGEHRPLR